MCIRDRPWLVLAFKLLPLLVVAPGLLMGSARGHAWACYVVNLYFILGVLAAFDPTQRLFGWAEVLLSVTLFCAALLYTCLLYTSLESGKLRPDQGNPARHYGETLLEAIHLCKTEWRRIWEEEAPILPTRHKVREESRRCV